MAGEVASLDAAPSALAFFDWGTWVAGTVPPKWPLVPYLLFFAPLFAMFASAWVSLATAPLTALHFQQVTVGGIVGNLVLTPLVELVALPLGLAGALLGGAGDPLVMLATATVALVDRATGLLAPILPVASIAIASQGVMAVLVAVALVLATRRQRSLLDVGLWVALCCSWSIARSPAKRDRHDRR